VTTYLLVEHFLSLRYRPPYSEGSSDKMHAELKSKVGAETERVRSELDTDFACDSTKHIGSKSKIHPLLKSLTQSVSGFFVYALFLRTNT
jgi:hypothetical protein